MFTAFYNLLLKIVFWLIGLIGSIVIYPIQILLVSLVPGIGEFITIFLDFMDEYFFPMLCFVKEAILDISCLPRPLWSILIGFMLSLWLIAPAIRGIRLIVNIWRIKSGGVTTSSHTRSFTLD